MDITFRPAKVTRVLIFAIALLVLASVAGQILKYGFGHGQLHGTVRLFNLMEEANIPTWFSSALLLVCAIWLGLIAKIKLGAPGQYGLHWALLAVIFLLLSMDETAQLHDLLDEELHLAFHPHGVLFYPWVVVAGAFILMLTAACLRLLRSLPWQTLRLFTLAAAVYIGGALGMETVAGAYDDVHGYENPTTAVLSTVEETMEMVGLVIFLHALMAYVASLDAHLRIRIDHTPRVSSQRAPDP